MTSCLKAVLGAFIEKQAFQPGALRCLGSLDVMCYGAKGAWATTASFVVCLTNWKLNSTLDMLVASIVRDKAFQME